MKDLSNTRARYMRDPLPVRLGGLAADLAYRLILTESSQPRACGRSDARGRALSNGALRSLTWKARRRCWNCSATWRAGGCDCHSSSLTRYGVFG